MSNDTMATIILGLVLALTFMVGLAMGYMRRDTEVRRAILLADIKSAELDDHWETAIRD
jgi:uncharacterized membrane protein